MGDDPDAWPEPWVYDEWKARYLEELEREKKMARESKKQPAPINPVRKAREEEFKGRPELRKWAVWRQYRAGGTSLRKVGEDFGILGERVRQLNAKCDRMLREALNRTILAFSVSDEIREATLGVEFVFRNELTFDPPDYTRKWERLEPYEYGSRYSEPLPEWRKEWGQQDKSPAKPRKVYTYYKVIIPKEQTND